MLTPKEFKSEIEKCTDMIEVANITNQLLEDLATEINEKTKKPFSTSTISKKLTEYRNEIKNVDCSPEFFENVATKSGLIKQHIAIKLLVLSDLQKSELESQRQNNEKKIGFYEDGSVKDVQYPKISIAQILEIACQFCKSNEANKLAIGIMLATGLRGENVCKSSIVVDGLMTSREMQWYSNFQISFNSISKKRGNERLNKYVIQTLIPADLVVSAYEKLTLSSDSKSILASEDFTNSALRKSIARLIDSDLKSQLQGIDDGHNLHICRAFYACVLNRFLENESINQMARKMIVKANLQHDNISETEKYLGKFENSQFTDIPKNIEIETNINEIGEIGMIQIEDETKIETEIVSEGDGLNLAKIISKLNPEMQQKFQEICYQNEGDIEKTLVDLLNSALEIKPKKLKSSNIVDNMIDAIHQFNLENENNPEKMIVPGYSFVDKLYQKFTNKQLARLTYLDILKNRNDVNQYLQGHISDVKNHNSKYHRKDVNEIIDRIIELMK